MNHKDKLKLARRIGTGQRRRGFSIFATSVWEARKDKIADRVEFKEEMAMQRKIMRNLDLPKDGK